MRILVTGAEGILGRAIREWLASGNTLYLWGRDEVDVPHPARVFGTAKKHLTVRTSWVFGEGGAHFVDAIADKLIRGEAPEVVTDQVGSPTYARDLARGIEKLLRLGTTGTVHVTNSGETTWHGFAVEIARFLGSPLPVRETTSDRFQRPAPRPKNSVLSGDR